MKERELLAEKRELEAEIIERQEALRAVEVLLNRLRQQSGQGPIQNFPLVGLSHGTNGTQKRVRGTLKAARRAVDQFKEQVFHRSELFGKIEEMNPNLAGKIKPEAMRGTIRTLLDEGWIEEKVSEETGEVQYRSILATS